MAFSDKIKAIETKAPIQPEWFYHAFHYKDALFANMLTEGIKCRKLMTKEFKKEYPHKGHNGNHYISLSKLELVSPEYSSFLYYHSKPAFIVNDINPIKCICSFDSSIFESTRWPIRYSGFRDEYQEYHQIPPEKLIGLRCSILEWKSGNYTYYLKSLKKMILFMKEHNITLPIYDYTRTSSYNAYLIAQDAYLELYDDMIKSFEEEKSKQKVYTP